jgi:hypothetical protein
MDHCGHTILDRQASELEIELGPRLDGMAQEQPNAIRGDVPEDYELVRSLRLRPPARVHELAAEPAGLGAPIQLMQAIRRDKQRGLIGGQFCVVWVGRDGDGSAGLGHANIRQSR